MAETEKSLTWFVGKSEAEIDEHYRRAEDFLYRPWGSTGDRGQEMVTCGDFDRTPAKDTLAEAGDEAETSRAKLDAFWVALAEWRAEKGIKTRVDETLAALATVERDKDGTPVWTSLGEILGVTRQTACDRYKAFTRHLPAIQEIARRVGLA